MIETAVVDASVGIKLFVEEEGSAQADILFSQLAESPSVRFYVPDLFFIECANVLWKYVRHFNYPADNARKDVADLAELDLSNVSTADLLPLALDLSLAYDITVYDSCYAALAQMLDLPLITADGTLARRLAESKVVVRLLLELQY